MRDHERRALEIALEAKVVGASGVGGGDINRAYRAELEGGSVVFVKAHDRAPEGFFAREADGLDWLRAACPLRVPEVRAVVEDGAASILVLDYIESSRPARDYDERLGEGLSELHRREEAQFGYADDNFIGRLHQEGGFGSAWPDYFAERRLLPMGEQGRRRGDLDASDMRALEALAAKLGTLVETDARPSRLHGDLWSGNAMPDDAGQPTLIDPAVYAGSREIDLAMMRLFGGFSGRVFDAYDAAYPLAPGYADRVPLYQLYPLLVHVALFGSSYAGSVRSILKRYA